MIFQWKLNGIYKVDAQTAGEELSRIYKEHGSLAPAQIVADSRDETAPLHPCFEWDDTVAAEKYRETQAGEIVRAIVAVSEDGGQEEKPVRAFVHVQDTFRPISVVVNSEEMMDELLMTALRELQSFRRKYQTLSTLRPVLDAIDKVTREGAA